MIEVFLFGIVLGLIPITLAVRWFYFSIFLTCSYGTKVEKIEKIG